MPLLLGFASPKSSSRGASAAGPPEQTHRDATPDNEWRNAPCRRRARSYATCVAIDGFVEGEGAVEGAVGDRLVGSDGCDSGADGVQVGERIALVRTKNCT